MVANKHNNLKVKTSIPNLICCDVLICNTPIHVHMDRSDRCAEFIIIKVKLRKIKEHSNFALLKKIVYALYSILVEMYKTGNIHSNE